MTKKKKKEPCKQFLPFYQESTKVSGTILQSSVVTHWPEEVPRGTLAVRRLEKNEGQDCWDWLITWRPHIVLPQIKVGLC